MVCATFSSRPATDMMILNVLPGASCACIALFSSGWSGLLRICVPVALAQPHRKLIGIERRTRRQREDLAGVRIHRDDGSDLAFQRLLGGHLDVEIDGQLQVLSGFRERLAEVADLFAVAVHDHVAAAVRRHAEERRRWPRRRTSQPRRRAGRSAYFDLLRSSSEISPT